MNILRLLLLMPTLASVAYSQITLSGAGLEEVAEVAEVADGAGGLAEEAEAAAIEAGLEEAAADIVSGLPNCTQYKIDFNTNNCTCNSGSTCSDKKSYYETNCINNC